MIAYRYDHANRRYAQTGEIEFVPGEQWTNDIRPPFMQRGCLSGGHIDRGRPMPREAGGTADREPMDKGIARQPRCDSVADLVEVGIPGEIEVGMRRSPLDEAVSQKMSEAVTESFRADRLGDAGIFAQIMSFGEPWRRVEFSRPIIAQIVFEKATVRAAANGSAS